ncbi:MAG: glycosyltransferase family 2 protein [Candidatus Buchananbacteria bacterium]
MSYPKVTIQIVTWNTLRYLTQCLSSIFAQSYRDFQVLVIDNGSQDGTLQFLKNDYPDVTVFQNHKNLGFAKANNQGIRLLNSPYMLLCNSDIFMESDWLEKAMALAESEKYSQYGSFGGKLIKMKLTGELREIEKTNVIDSCGLKILKNRQVVEIGAGEDSSGYNDRIDVFGQSAALALYRREALNNCAIKIGNQDEEEYFDEDFFSYKEDVDLAWRMNLFGWKSIYDPSLVAYHARSASGSEKTSMMDIIKNKGKQSELAKFYSYRNHFLLLKKNEFKKNFMKDFWTIFPYEMKKFFYFLLFDFKNLKAIGEVFKLGSKMKKKGDLIKNNSKASSEMINKWIN